MLKKCVTYGVLFICAFMIVIAGCSQKKDDVEIRIGFQVIPNTEAIAKANGWHEQKLSNASIKWLPFESGRDVNSALAAGSIDIGLLGTTLVATGLANGLDYQVIWLADVIGDNEALVVRSNKDISSVQDLKGKSIAVTFGSTTQYTLLSALKANEIDPSEVEIIDLRPPEMLAAWLRSDIDAGYVWHPTLQEMINNGGHVLISSGDLIEHGIITADVIVARTSFIDQHPTLVRDYLASHVRAVQYYTSNPVEAAADIGKEFEISANEAMLMMEELIWLTGAEQASDSYLGGKNNAGAFASVLQDTAQFLYDQGLITSMPDQHVFSKAVNGAPLQEALQQSSTGSTQ